MTTTDISGIRAVSIPVSDQDRALEFYAGTLGWTPGAAQAPVLIRAAVRHIPG